MEDQSSPPLWLKALSGFAILFGCMTLLEGGKVLFPETGRIGAGNIVPFVLWFNWIAGFFYIIAGVGLFRMKSCAKKLSSVIAVGSLLVLIALIVHIQSGGLYEMRTIFAMSFRTLVWISIATVTWKSKSLKKCGHALR